jgi:hypothetical protein
MQRRRRKNSRAELDTAVKIGVWEESMIEEGEGGAALYLHMFTFEQPEFYCLLRLRRFALWGREWDGFDGLDVDSHTTDGVDSPKATIY